MMASNLLTHLCRWIGEARPAAGLEAEVPVNPIKWSLSLCAGPAPSAFGAGYFDDAGDIPGQVLELQLSRASLLRCSGNSRFAIAFPQI